MDPIAGDCWHAAVCSTLRKPSAEVWALSGRSWRSRDGQRAGAGGRGFLLPSLPISDDGESSAAAAATTTAGRKDVHTDADGRLDGWDGADSISHAYQNQASLRLMRASERTRCCTQTEGGDASSRSAHQEGKDRTDHGRQCVFAQYLLAMSPT